MEQFEFYTLDENDKPRKVSREHWRLWMRTVDVRKICVAESHLICRENQEGKCVVNTRFTGCDRYPGLEEPYLWETVSTYMGVEPARYTSPEMAKERHEDRVRYAIQLLKHDNIVVERKDIDIHKKTEIEHGR
jgi:hypothetical protein